MLFNESYFFKRIRIFAGCRICKEEGHFAKDCPNKREKVNWDEAETRTITKEDGTTAEIYIPKEIAEDDLFQQGISSGINFNKFDKIPVSFIQNAKSDFVLKDFTIYLLICSTPFFFAALNLKVFVLCLSYLSFVYLICNITNSETCRSNVAARTLLHPQHRLKAWVFEKSYATTYRSLDTLSQLQSKSILFPSLWISGTWWRAHKLVVEKLLRSFFRKFNFVLSKLNISHFSNFLPLLSIFSFYYILAFCTMFSKMSANQTLEIVLKSLKL